jgi:hypothetical protein
MCGTVRARDGGSQLGGRVGGVDKHLAGAGAGLGCETGGYVFGEAEGCGAGDEVLDNGEEVGRAGA